MTRDSIETPAFWPASSNRAVAALAAFPLPKARVDQIDDDTVENGSRDRRPIGERDAAHMGVVRAATDNP